jgi:hypothetical protein
MALDAMRDALAQGWSGQHLMQDHARHVLADAGYSDDDANAAVQVVWARHFAIMPPV